MRKTLGLPMDLRQSAAAMFAAGLLFSTISLAHTVEIEGMGSALEQVPVSVEVPAELAGKPVVLKDAAGTVIPSQWDARNKKLVFIVPKIGAKETLRWTLEAGQTDLPNGQGVQLKETEDGLDILIDGALFTRYLIKAGPKPYFWPFHGPSGNPITRAYPMDSSVEGEERDHVHHRSFWFTHGDVNGIDFWAEGDNRGKTVHRAFEDIVQGPVFGEFTSIVDWNKPDGTKIAEDRRRFRFYRVTNERLFDVDIALRGTSGPLTMGDTKEGSFGFRFDRTMRMDKRKGGMIVNSEGQRNLGAWGKRAKWCDCYGPLDGEVVGIAMFDSPTSFRFPTYWHVRQYGLFCANPFGLHDFNPRANEKGTHVIHEGEELKLAYRIYIHRGTNEEAHVAEQYEAFATPPKATVK